MRSEKKYRIDVRRPGEKELPATGRVIFKRYILDSTLHANFDANGVLAVRKSAEEGGSWVRLNDKCEIRAIAVETCDIWYKE